MDDRVRGTGHAAAPSALAASLQAELERRKRAASSKAIPKAMPDASDYKAQKAFIRDLGGVSYWACSMLEALSDAEADPDVQGVLLVSIIVGKEQLAAVNDGARGLLSEPHAPQVFTRFAVCRRRAKPAPARGEGRPRVRSPSEDVGSSRGVAACRSAAGGG